jgi:hypothetical protein
MFAAAPSSSIMEPPTQQKRWACCMQHAWICNNRIDIDDIMERREEVLREFFSSSPKPKHSTLWYDFCVKGPLAWHRSNRIHKFPAPFYLNMIILVELSKSNFIFERITNLNGLRRIRNSLAIVKCIQYITLHIHRYNIGQDKWEKDNIYTVSGQK